MDSDAQDLATNSKRDLGHVASLRWLSVSPQGSNEAIRPSVSVRGLRETEPDYIYIHTEPGAESGVLP